jgi:hypothetical protein
MIQTIVTPQQKHFDLSIDFPTNYVGKKVHILFYTDDEVSNANPLVSNKSSIAADLADSFNDIKLYEQGKKKLKLAKDILNEL